MAKPALDLAALTPDEKVDLIDDIWSSFRADELQLTPEQTVELDRRLERLDRDGPVGTPWDVVRAEMSPSRQ
jgi:putative addiction module component (TIGR02574 family)